MKTIRADDAHHCGIDIVVQPNANLLGEICLSWEGNCDPGAEIFIARDSALQLAAALIQGVLDANRRDS